MKSGLLKIIYVLSTIAIIAVFFIDPILQNQEYHKFADQVSFFSIPNFWNVISNFPFVLIGFAGLWKSLINSKNHPLERNFSFFFFGVLCTGFGSAYYHYNPNDTSLIWDRLPMTISFMSFLSIILSEFIALHIGKKMLYPFLLTGCLSVIYWAIFKDLRFYLLVQFLPILLMIFILLLTKMNTNLKKYFWLILFAYIVAKFLESYDLQIYNLSNRGISGHSLKHFAAAIASLIFYKYSCKKNENLSENAT
ncbi:MAG: ceramidase domain-containing protein [Bacteroidota bacterium]